MIIQKSDLEGVITVTPDIFEDHRGQYVETYNLNLYKQSGIQIDFVQDDISASRQNVLRGLHGDRETWKLVSCLHGEIYLVVLDAREESPQFGTWQSFMITDRNRMQVLVPPGFANGHLVMSEMAIFHYKQSTYYNPEKQFTIPWNDNRFSFWWPISNPILSRRDQARS